MANDEPGVRVDRPPLDVPVVDHRTGKLTKAGRDFLHRQWERSGGFEDFIASVQQVLAGYEQLANQLESLEAELANVQTLLAESVGALVYSETADLSERIEALQSEIAQVANFASGFDQDEIRYTNITDKPTPIDALDDLGVSPGKVPYFDSNSSASTKDLSGADASIITGTAGAAGELMEFNSDGDAVEVTELAALTGTDTSTVDNTYGSEEANVITNTRTRVDELEARLKTKGILP